MSEHRPLVPMHIIGPCGSTLPILTTGLQQTLLNII